LDVGCGPFGLPFYLEGFPPEQFAGLEPLPANTADVQIVRGISEYLPWPDHSFATVISATSLDHCLSLDRSLAEVIRVLKPGGRFLLWIGSNPGSPPFRPLDPAFTPADQYHLFHFDTSWFEPLLSQSFVIEDRARFDRGSYSHVFYCLTPSQERPDARV
jgi:ubiquinone/menaquinone biosynthesis C-methylase UbiE